MLDKMDMICPINILIKDKFQMQYSDCQMNVKSRKWWFLVFTLFSNTNML